jgi:cysteinyl-tRNA synthetase
MSMQYLGDTLDIHCGGIDHIPVHNTNEIAQSECASGKIFARFWLHGAFLNVKGASGPGHAKMAKSGDNFITVDRLIERGCDPIAYRYLTLTAHYRSELAFSWDSLAGAERALARVYDLPRRLGGQEPLDEVELNRGAQRIEAALLDDLNAARAIALLHEYGSPALWERFDSVLGLDYAARSVRSASPGAMAADVSELVAARDVARRARNYSEADRLRAEIENAGYVVRDGIRDSVIEPTS